MHETHPVGATPRRTISPATLAFTMFGMVAGGPFGLEDVMSSVSYGYAILVILVTLVFWSVPTTFMQAELASSRPNSGGFYIWTRDALGPFAGFMQGWLAIGSSIFDMPIYPTLVRGYLARVWPQVETGSWPLIIGVAVVVIGIVWNLLGARGIGRLASAVSIYSKPPGRLPRVWA